MQSLFPIEKLFVNFDVTDATHINGNNIYYYIGNEVGLFEKYNGKDYSGYIFKSDNGKNYFISTIKNKYPANYDAVFLIDVKKYPTPSIKILESCEKKLVSVTVPSVEQIQASWEHSFFYKKEIRDNNDKIRQEGLRPPQIGALYAIQAHWSISDKTALIVMPTGTGKTETMLCLTVAEQLSGLLVMVPSDSLRTQIADKFKTLGILKNPKFGIVTSNVLYPKVGFLKSGIKNIEDAKQIFQCNVVVSTPQLINGLLQGETQIRNIFLRWCSHAIMDEAHHSQAKTWKHIKDSLEKASKKLLLFTATPFRNDKKRLMGDIIYNYPLSLAQRDKYYKNIEFHPILEFNNKIAEQKIAEQAIELLLNDRKKGLDHFLMARVDKRKEAERIYDEIYKKYKDLNPIYIHSKIKNAEKKLILERIKNGVHKIIVCVDMLGEGFDLPQLKICALHDLHKNITTSFQFFGRFTRESKLNLGNAKIVANIADPNLKGTLKKLYKKDSDWDKIISHSSEDIIDNVVNEERFFKNFSDAQIPNKIPLRNITPAMSTVVYKIEEDYINWNAENYTKYFKQVMYETVSVEHNEQNLLVVIAKKTNPVKWGKIDDLVNCDYDLYIIYLNTDQKLLYINSTNNGSTHSGLANYVVSGQKSLFNEANIYRCLDNIFQLELFNLGLKSILDGPISFTMYAGNGIVTGLDEIDNNKTSSNLFGVGYENGDKVTIGCSSKGRVWTKLVKSIPEFCSWCDKLGTKLLDESIDTKDIFKFIQKPEQIEMLPEDKVPVSIRWSEEFYYHPTRFICKEHPIVDFRIEFLSYTKTSIRFLVKVDKYEAMYSLNLLDNKTSRVYQYELQEGFPITVHHKNELKELSELFKDYPPIIWFHDNSKMYNNIYFPFKGKKNIFSIDKIIPYDWTGVDIRKESQKKVKREDSIQFSMIQRLKTDDECKIIFDDDDANEASDIIAIKYFESETNRIIVELYHCKYSSKPTSGGRLKDLYEVCGQAQRSYHWRHYTVELINHMLRREELRINKNNPSRFEVGGNEEIGTVLNMLTSGYCQIDFNIYVVQPGIKKSVISNESEHLTLLGATDILLKKTGNEFYVITDN